MLLLLLLLLLLRSSSLPLAHAVANFQVAFKLDVCCCWCCCGYASEHSRHPPQEAVRA